MKQMNCRQADKALTNSQKQQELADPDPSPLIGWMHLVPRLKLGFKLIKTMVVIRIRIIIIIFFFTSSRDSVCISLELGLGNCTLDQFAVCLQYTLTLENYCIKL